MASASDMKTRFKSLVTELQKSVECPVCLETIKTPFKVCVRGHAACIECIKKLEKCPLCQECYVLENPVCIRSILNVLPHLCLYSTEGCKEIVEPGNDHEIFCGYRPIVCREVNCSVKMPLVQFLDHHKNHHPEWYLCKEKNENISWEITLDSKMTEYTPVSLFNNIFWILEINDVKEKQFKIYFQATPNGKLEHDYYVRVTFTKDDFVYTYTIKATVLSSCDSKYTEKENNNSEETTLCCEQYCMRIPQDELCRFIDEDGKLDYTYKFFRV